MECEKSFWFRESFVLCIKGTEFKIPFGVLFQNVKSFTESKWRSPKKGHYK